MKKLISAIILSLIPGIAMAQVGPDSATNAGPVGNASAAALLSTTDDNATSADEFPLWQATAGGAAAVSTSSIKLIWRPGTGSLGLGGSPSTFSVGGGLLITQAPGVLRMINQNPTGRIYEIITQLQGVSNAGWTLRDITGSFNLLMFDNLGGPRMPTIPAAAGASTACVGTASVFAITSVPSGTACASSAMRYKDSIGLLNDKDAAGLMDLHAAVFRYKKGDASDDGRVHVGLYADDVKKMDPRCVVYLRGKLENYEDRCVIAYLTKVVQKQEREIAELKRRR